VLLNVGNNVPAALQGAVATLAWVHAGRPTYALEGIINSSAATLNWLRDQLGIISGAEEADALAREVGAGQEVYLVPAFSGLGAPHWRPTARAAIVGLSAHSDRRHVARAALEAMAYQLRDVLDMMHAEAGIELRHIQADGGPSSSEFLMQFTADIIGVELRVARYPDCSARGAALMGALGLGLHSSMHELANLRCDERFYSRKMAVEQAQSRYVGWQKAVQQVLCAA
jgi:glycerol kinase